VFFPSIELDLLCSFKQTKTNQKKMYTSYGFMEKSIKSLSLKYKNSLWATQNTPFNLSVESGQNSNENKKGIIFRSRQKVTF